MPSTRQLARRAEENAARPPASPPESVPEPVPSEQADARRPSARRAWQRLERAERLLESYGLDRSALARHAGGATLERIMRTCFDCQAGCDCQAGFECEAGFKCAAGGHACRDWRDADASETDARDLSCQVGADPARPRPGRGPGRGPGRERGPQRGRSCPNQALIQELIEEKRQKER